MTSTPSAFSLVTRAVIASVAEGWMRLRAAEPWGFSDMTISSVACAVGLQKDRKLRGAAAKRPGRYSQAHRFIIYLCNAQPPRHAPISSSRRTRARPCALPLEKTPEIGKTEYGEK